mgnify:CR=1 FL=1
MKKILLNILEMPLILLKRVELLLIKVYQKTLSLDYGILGKIYPNFRSCKFTPTCSEYGYEAVEKYGVIKGSGLAIKRVLRCNPWTKDMGSDPVP